MSERWPQERIVKTIAAIEAWQTNKFVHPLTCGNNSNHTPLVAWPVEGRVILACPDCAYIQVHIPQAVLEAKLIKLDQSS